MEKYEFYFKLIGVSVCNLGKVKTSVALISFLLLEVG